MKAAVYARKSTDDNDKNADNKSVARQTDNAKAFATARGWTIDPAHVFVDDNLSGASFNRPGLLRMLTHLTQFDVVVMSELSRLGREQLQTSKVLADLQAHGVDVYLYLSNERLNYDSAIDKFLVNAVSFAAELEREKASQRSRDALERKARKGYVTGGAAAYGYRNVQVFGTNVVGEQVRTHTDLEIDKKQAEIVRGIFRMYKAGHGFSAIAKAMNGDPKYSAQNIQYFRGQTPPAPRKGTGSWAPSSVRAILINDRYTGRINFGKYRKRLRGGVKVREEQDKFLSVDRPDLRIVDTDLWEAVQYRMKSVRATYVRDTGGKLWGRPETGRASRYLLSGIARCSACGGTMSVLSSKAGKRYVCSYHHNRGSTVCTNDHRVLIDQVDDAVIDAIARTTLTPAVVAEVIQRAAAKVRERQQQDPALPQRLRAQIGQLRRELDRLVAAIASGGTVPARVLEEIHGREKRIKALETDLEQLDAATTPTDDLGDKRLERALSERMAHFQDLLRSNVPVARQALRKLLEGPIRLTPVVENGRKSYRFEGQTRVGPLLSEGFISMASPRGFEPLLPA